MRATLIALLAGILFIAGCTEKNPTSAAIAKQFTDTGGQLVNLAKISPNAWSRVCILGPYSNNEAAAQALGFSWDLEGKTSVFSSDAVSLLVFANSQEVIFYVEHPRNQGDFSNLSKQCFAKAQARFSHDSRPDEGWPGLFPISDKRQIDTRNTTPKMR
jgi:putative lipase involved disintegration of autophagic bodies